MATRAHDLAMVWGRIGAAIACDQAGATQSMQRLLLKSLAPVLDAPARPHRPMFSGSLAEGPKIIEDVSSDDLHRGFEETSWVEVSDPQLDGRAIIVLRSIGRRGHG